MASTSDIAQRRAVARANDDPEYRLRRAEIVEAAAHVFRRRGYKATKLDDIAKAIGKDRASLYYYTSGKEELFQEVVAEAVLDNVCMVEELCQQRGKAKDKVAKLISGLMLSYQKHFPYLFVYVQEPMAHMDGRSPWDRRMQDLGRRFDEAVRAIVQEGLDDGTFASPTADARLIANGIIGMCNWSHRWFHPKDEESAIRVSEIFMSMVLNGLVTRADG